MTRASLVLVCAILAPAVAHADPCTTATPQCTEWVKLGGGEARTLVYRTYPLDTKNEAITRALVVIHGSSRDADNYFRSALAAAFLAGALDDTVIISPRIASNDGPDCHDTLAPDEISWSCSGNTWRTGGAAVGNDRLTSFDLVDEILRTLGRKNSFPNLKGIVLAGHSAGGQFVNRYEMANQVHDSLGVSVTYVVANPSSYAYLDPRRPVGAAEVGPFEEGRNCTTYDAWPYGLQNRSGYAARLSDDQLKRQLAARPVVYLLGDLDILPLGGFDSSCCAMAQGPTRFARGQAYGTYVNQKYGAQHKVITIPLCGHNARCMFTAEPALHVLFPRG